jgi:hypothetical protein
VRLRDSAATTGVTERTAYGIVTDLTQAGYVALTAERHRRHLVTPGTASGILNSARQVGGAPGVALLGSLLGSGHAIDLRLPLTVAVGGYLVTLALTWIGIRRGSLAVRQVALRAADARRLRPGGRGTDWLVRPCATPTRRGSVGTG